ncbi:MAG: YeeE/YedE thiosulfate transporter family protein [Polyangia bacterium]
MIHPDWLRWLHWQPSFTRALAGGVLIGTSASLLLGTLGRIAGWSGVVSSLVTPVRGHVAWRVALVVGLLLGGLAAVHFLPGSIPSFAFTPRSAALLVGGGLLVGSGTRIGNGCTSGHGVCGISRGSPRSIVATITFIGTGIATVAVMRALGLLS